MQFSIVLFFGAAMVLSVAHSVPTLQKVKNPDRRQYHNSEKSFEERNKRYDVSSGIDRSYDYKERSPKSDGIMFSINTGNSDSSSGTNKFSKILDSVFEALNIKTKKPSSSYRTRDYNAGGADRDTMKWEINAKNIVNGISTLLESPEVLRYTDLVARKAALLYDTVSDELTRN